MAKVGRPPQALDERFWSKVQRSDECWLWTARTDNDGYGRFRLGDKQVMAHRLAYELWCGIELPPASVVMHSCDNPPCVNPTHLQVGTHALNIADRHTKRRDAQGEGHGTHTKPESVVRGGEHHWSHRNNPDHAVGTLNGRSKLTPQQVQAIRHRLSFGKVNKSALGREYGVSDTVIHNIGNGKLWSHLQEEAV